MDSSVHRVDSEDERARLRVPLLEALAPAGWHQGPVTGRKVMDAGQGEPMHTDLSRIGGPPTAF